MKNQKKEEKHMEQVQFDLRTPRLRRNTFATMLLAFLLPESYVYVL
jgi:F0F1-type ATP synthase membrane subunit c/vacuolar-type H+-ATPase subunit K